MLSSSVAIAFKWRGLAPWGQRLLRVVVRVAWLRRLIRCDPEPEPKEQGHYCDNGEKLLDKCGKERMATRSYIPCSQGRVVNLLQECGVAGDLVRDANWFGGTGEFHKRLSF